MQRAVHCRRCVLPLALERDDRLLHRMHLAGLLLVLLLQMLHLLTQLLLRGFRLLPRLTLAFELVHALLVSLLELLLLVVFALLQPLHLVPCVIGPIALLAHPARAR